MNNQWGRCYNPFASANKAVVTSMSSSPSRSSFPSLFFFFFYCVLICCYFSFPAPGQQLVDDPGNVWTITSGGMIAVNGISLLSHHPLLFSHSLLALSFSLSSYSLSSGVTDTLTANVMLLTYVIQLDYLQYTTFSFIWQKNKDNFWWYKNGTEWKYNGPNGPN